MEIYFLRHGIAAKKNSRKFKCDADRPLTNLGRKQLRKIGKAMKQRDLKFDLILTSPFLRAAQTAKIVAKGLKAKKHVKFFPALSADQPAAHSFQELGKIKKRSLLLVGHEPHLTDLISLFVAPKCKIKMNLQKGGICKLIVDENGGTLEWLMSPELFCGKLIRC